MGKGKDLPAVDFHAVLAKRDPALAERLSREGVGPSVEAGMPTLFVVPAPPTELHMAPSVSPERHKGPRRGLVPRADGREAGRITVYVPPELALKLRAYCFERDLTMTNVAAQVLVAALQQLLRSE
jgi:hypothetical protein